MIQTNWPNPDLAAHAREIRRAVFELDHKVPEIADLLDPLLEVADQLDRLAKPIAVWVPR